MRNESRRASFSTVAPMVHLSLGLGTLVLLQQIGAQLVQRFAIPLPPAVIGMVVLLILLVSWGRLRPMPRALQEASSPLLRHMMLFFIPPVAGIVEQFPALAAGWFPFLVASVAGAAVTLAVTAVTLQRLLDRQNAVQ